MFKSLFDFCLDIEVISSVVRTEQFTRLDRRHRGDLIMPTVLILGVIAIITRTTGLTMVTGKFDLV